MVVTRKVIGGSRRKMRNYGLLSAAAVMAGAQVASAATFTWSGASAATWNTTGTNWVGTPTNPWVTGSHNTALFDATASGYSGGLGTATVAASTSIFVDEIDLTVTGWTITGTAASSKLVGQGGTGNDLKIVLTNGVNCTLANAGVNGTTDLIVTGAGTLTMSDTNTTANNYSGGTTVNGGATLKFGSDANLGATSGTVTLDNGMLSATAGLTTARNFFLGPTAGNGGGSLAEVTAKALTISGIVADNTGGTTDSLTLNGATSTSTFVLSGSNSYSGGTFVNGGVLSMGNASAVGTGNITFNASGTLQWNGITTDVSGKLQTLTGTTVVTLDPEANNVIFATANGLSGASTSGYTKLAASAGTLTLSAANNFSGTYIASSTGGATILKNTNALQNATVTPLTTTTGGITFDSSVGGSFTFGNLSGAGNLALQDNLGAAITLTLGGSNSPAAYSGVLSGPGSLIMNGTGTLTLSNAANTYTGTTTVTGGGTVSVGADQNLGAVPGSVVNNITLNNGTLTSTASIALTRIIHG